MDAVDKSIILDFMTNCRITYQEMAQKNGISANAIKKRVDKMLDMGIIEDFHLELSLAMVDAEMVMCLIHTDGTEETEEFVEKVGSYSAVNTIGKTSGGVYIIYAAYTGGSKGLSELGSFLRNLGPVKNVELHTLLFPLGKKVVFSMTELIVLRHLVKNPRMTISEITKKSGMTSRMARKVVNGLKEGSGLNFSARINPNAGDSITFLTRIYWDEKMTDVGKILSWVQKRFPSEFYVPIITATNPLLFIAFIVNDLKDISLLSEEIKGRPGVLKVINLLGEPSRTFPDIKTIRLEEILAEAGF